jgi:glutaredoxin
MSEAAGEVVLYGRPECHLCDEARDILDGLIVLSEGSLVLREVDIDEDEELLLRYLERIPVIEHHGEVISELVPDPQALQNALLHNSSR